MASTKNMSWYTPIPARRAQRRRITSGTVADAARGRRAKLENMRTPTPAFSPSPSLYDTTSGLDGIDVGISLDTCNRKNCNHHNKHDRNCTDSPLPNRPVEQRSNMGRSLALPTRPNTAFRANPSLPAREDASPCGRRDFWSMLRSINDSATMRLVEIVKHAGSAGVPEVSMGHANYHKAL